MAASVDFAGSARRSFRFPAPPAEAFAFHADVARAIGFLAHIEIASCGGEDRFHLVYAATEAGLYRVRIHCDVLAHADPQALALRIRPIEPGAPVRFEAGLNSMTGAGRYASDVVFVPDGQGTRVDCSLSLAATLPVARSLRLLPRTIVAAGARRIVSRRIDEILERFSRESVAAFEHERRAAGAAA
jgi:hypothetical protein